MGESSSGGREDGIESLRVAAIQYFIRPVQSITLYAADVMVAPDARRRGIGSRLYAARRKLVRRLGLKLIRTGARLRRYHRYAGELSAQEYVERIVDGRIRDPTLTFQLRQGFRVLAVAPDYLPRDPLSMGYAAVIEWTVPEGEAGPTAS